MTNLEVHSEDYGSDEADTAYVLQSGSANWSDELRNLPPNLPHFDASTVIERLLPVRARPVSDTDAISLQTADTPRSMAVNVEKRLRRGGGLSPSITDARNPPSLISGSSTLDCSQTLSNASEVLANGGPIDEDGNLLQRLAQLQCEFWYLDCPKVFDVVEYQAFHEHCMRHLGPNEPPTEVECPYLDCAWIEKQEHGYTAWTLRQQHIEECHLFDDISMQLWKPKVAGTLLTHLWNNHIIDSIQRRVLILQGCRRVVPASFIQSHGDRSAETRRDRPRRLG